MEGLIPFIYRAIKERRSRSYSRCSSSARGFAGGVDDDVAADWQQQKQWARGVDGRAARGAGGGGGGGGGRLPAEREMTQGQQGHRRHRSLEELAGEVGASSSPEWRAAGVLPRGRSARIFSCISGM